MGCGCAARDRAARHRDELAVPRDRQPLPFPAALAQGFSLALCAQRRALLEARGWLAAQPIGPRRLATHQILQRWEDQLRVNEQQILRVGTAATDGAMLR